MTKRLFCVFALLLCSRICLSQVLIALVFGDKLNTDKIGLGIQLSAQGFQLTNTKDQVDLGFAFGAYLDIKLSEKLTVSNYFMFKSPKGGKNIPQEYWFNQNEPLLTNDVTLKRHLTYMEFTPMLRYHLNAVLSVSLGPQFAVNTKGTDIYQDKTDDGNITYRYRLSDDITLMDVGMAFDIQWQLMKGKGLRINARFAQSFINIYKDSEFGNAKNQAFQLGVGIPIGGRKTNPS